MRSRNGHMGPFFMRSPDDIRPGTINGVLGVAKQMPCDATLSASECRELYDYINHLEHVLNTVVRQLGDSDKAAIFVEGDVPEGIELPDTAVWLTPDQRDVIQHGSMCFGAEVREGDIPYWKLARARDRRARWWKAQEKRHAKQDAESGAQENP